MCARFSLLTMSMSGMNERPVSAVGQSVRPRALPNVSMGKWYPIKLAFQYRAYSDGRLVQTGTGETIEISTRALRVRIPEELPARAAELDLAIAWPVPLDGVIPLLWAVRAKPAWRAPGWIFVCVASQELRTGGARGRQLLAACG
jgi:hypothetical protein